MATRTHCAHRYFVPLAKYFTVCITYQPPLVLAEFGECQGVGVYDILICSLDF